MGVAASNGATAGAPRVTTLSGTEEVSGGDPDGTGFATITLNVGTYITPHSRPGQFVAS